MNSRRIPDEVIEAVLKHHDIVDVIGKYVNLSKQGHYLKGLCPFHSEKSPSFTVTPDKQIFYCFGCHAGGNAIQFVKEIEGLSYTEAVQQMAEEANLALDWQIPAEQQTEQQKNNAILLDANEIAAKWYHHVLKNTIQGREAMQYLHARGFSDKLIDFFQIGYAPQMQDKLMQFLKKRAFSLPLMEKGGLLSAKSSGGYVDKFRDRVMFPICDMKGRVIAFAGRAMKDAEPKYLNSPETTLFNKSKSLYNFHHARAHIRKSRQVVLFEGYVDVIKAWEAGVFNGVATMGTALTEEHAERIKHNAEELIICYDGDKAGQAAAFKGISMFEHSQMRVRVAMLPDNLDPDEYIAANGAERFLHEVIENAVPPIKYKLVYVRKQYNLQTVEGKRRYLDAAIAMISQLPSPIDREHYAKELSVDFQYSHEAIKQELNEQRQHFLKRQQMGDNKPQSWNNDRNDGRDHGRKPALSASFQHFSEKKLLAAMIENSHIAEKVRLKIGEHFNVEAHAALAAYLYAYYALGNNPNASKYMATLQDEHLESVVSSILMSEANQGFNDDVIDSYIQEIENYPLLQGLANKKQEALRAQNAGDVALAVKLQNEIITLKQQLKMF